MAFHIAALSGIIPVISQPNNPPVVSTAPEPPDVGARWGKSSQFQFSSLNPPPNKGGGGVTIRNSEVHKYETRVESFDVAPMWKTQDYDVPVHNRLDGHFVRNDLHETWTDAWYKLGEDNFKILAGITAHADGSKTYRYRSETVKQIGHFAFAKTDSTPNLRSATHTYGDLSEV